MPYSRSYLNSPAADESQSYYSRILLPKESATHEEKTQLRNSNDSAHHHLSNGHSRYSSSVRSTPVGNSRLTNRTSRLPTILNFQPHSAYFSPALKRRLHSDNIVASRPAKTLHRTIEPPCSQSTVDKAIRIMESKKRTSPLLTESFISESDISDERSEQDFKRRRLSTASTSQVQDLPKVFTVKNSEGFKFTSLGQLRDSQSVSVKKHVPTSFSPTHAICEKRGHEPFYAQIHHLDSVSVGDTNTETRFGHVSANRFGPSVRRRIPYMSPSEIDALFATGIEREITELNNNDVDFCDSDNLDIYPSKDVSVCTDSKKKLLKDCHTSTVAITKSESDVLSEEASSSSVNRLTDQSSEGSRVGSVARFIANLEARSFKSLSIPNNSSNSTDTVSVASSPSLSRSSSSAMDINSRINRIRSLLSNVPTTDGSPVNTVNNSKSIIPLLSGIGVTCIQSVAPFNFSGTVAKTSAVPISLPTTPSISAPHLLPSVTCAIIDSSPVVSTSKNVFPSLSSHSVVSSAPLSQLVPAAPFTLPFSTLEKSSSLSTQVPSITTNTTVLSPSASLVPNLLAFTSSGTTIQTTIPSSCATGSGVQSAASLVTTLATTSTATISVPTTVVTIYSNPLSTAVTSASVPSTAVVFGKPFAPTFTGFQFGSSTGTSVLTSVPAVTAQPQTCQGLFNFSQVIKTTNPTTGISSTLTSSPLTVSNPITTLQSSSVSENPFGSIVSSSKPVVTSSFGPFAPLFGASTSTTSSATLQSSPFTFAAVTSVQMKQSVPFCFALTSSPTKPSTSVSTQSAPSIFTFGSTCAAPSFGLPTSTSAPSPFGMKFSADASKPFSTATISNPFTLGMKPAFGTNGISTTSTSNNNGLFNLPSNSTLQWPAVSTSVTSVTSSSPFSFTSNAPVGLYKSITSPGQLFQFTATSGMPVAVASASPLTSHSSASSLFTFGNQQTVAPQPFQTNVFNSTAPSSSSVFQFGVTKSPALSGGFNFTQQSTAPSSIFPSVSSPATNFVFGQTPTVGVQSTPNPFTFGTSSPNANAVALPRRRPTASRRTRRP